MLERNIEKVLIIGGGTAGWLAACHLAKTLRSDSPQGVQVHLVQAKNIPTIGVGEGTVPAIRESLKYLGISETELIQKCDVAFKQSIKFVNWATNPQAKEQYYHHVFDYPNTYDFDLTPYWVMGKLGTKSYADCVSIQSHLCDRGLAPKTMLHKEYDGIASYAYHLDAAKFGDLLANHAIENLGVRKHEAEIVDVALAEDGHISHLITDEGLRLEADFFVDCSGFESAVFGKKMHVPLVDKSSILFADKALALQVPYQNERQELPSSTIATAVQAGWIWDIALPTRRGTGYVYSSSHISDDRAASEFANYLGDDKLQSDFRSINMKIGYRERFWVKNCAAIGLSQGFVEPLEATGLLMFDATARMLAELLPSNKALLPSAASQFNSILSDTWEAVVDFIKLHYCLSRRDDSDFWIDNRGHNSMSESLLAKLDAWQYRLPNRYDFTQTNSVFNLDNYLYVLFGMDFKSQLDAVGYRHKDDQTAVKMMVNNQAVADKIIPQLLPHREIIERINRHGLQTI